MVRQIKNAIKRRIPIYRYYQRVVQELAIWKKGLYPPGHYYSPLLIPESVAPTGDINYHEPIPGIDVNDEGQFKLLHLLQPLYSGDLFPKQQQHGYRYYFENDYYSYSDGIFLHLMMRSFRPLRIIEVGSGFSSALMLDTNEKFFGNKIKLTFIEPFPEERLDKLLQENEDCVIHKKLVQEVDIALFTTLEAGDMLFIDSSHVSKYQSDLNHILFSVLPSLKPGVIIHFHDVFFPFEYPAEWMKQGRSWNEAYLLRAFLQYNSSFEILLFTSFMEGKFRAWFEENMPMCLDQHEHIRLDGTNQMMKTTGQSIYLLKKG